MNSFLLIYSAISLVVFVFLEAFFISECRRDNAIFTVPVYRVDHLTLFISAALFPIFILIIIVGLVTDFIVDRRNK